MQKGMLAFGILAIMILSSMSFVSADSNVETSGYSPVPVPENPCPQGQMYQMNDDGESCVPISNPEVSTDSLPFAIPHPQVAECPPGQDYNNPQAVCQPIVSNPGVSADSVPSAKTTDASVTPAIASSNGGFFQSISNALSQLVSIVRGLFGF